MIVSGSTPSGASYLVLEGLALAAVKLTSNAPVLPADTFTVWGSLDDTVAGGEPNLYALGTLAGSSGDPSQIPLSPLLSIPWSRVVFRRLTGANAGEIELQGPAWGRNAPETLAVPTTAGVYSDPLDFDTSEQPYVVALDKAATSVDAYLVWGTNSSTTRSPKSGKGGVPLGQLRGGGLAPPIFVNGYRYIIVQCVKHGAATNIVGVQTQSAGSGGGEGSGVVAPTPNTDVRRGAIGEIYGVEFRGAAGAPAIVRGDTGAEILSVGPILISSHVTGEAAVTTRVQGTTTADGSSLIQATAGSATGGQSAEATGGDASATMTATSSSGDADVSTQSTGASANADTSATSTVTAASAQVLVTGHTTANINRSATGVTGSATALDTVTASAGGSALAGLTATGVADASVIYEAQRPTVATARMSITTDVGGGTVALGTGVASAIDRVTVDPTGRVGIGGTPGGQQLLLVERSQNASTAFQVQNPDAAASASADVLLASDDQMFGLSCKSSANGSQPNNFVLRDITNSVDVLKFDPGSGAMTLNTGGGGGAPLVINAPGAMEVNGPVAIGASAAAPAASALLDVHGVTGGLLFPRMTTVQRDAISAPAEGLCIYNLTTHKLNLRTAAAWEVVTSV